MTTHFIDLSTDLLYELLFRLKGSDLLNLCQTNREMNDICNSLPDHFWRRKFFSDNGAQRLRKPAQYTWKQYYLNMALNNLKEVRSNASALFWMHRNMTYGELFSKIAAFVPDLSYSLPLKSDYSNLTQRYRLIVCNAGTSPKLYYTNFITGTLEHEPITLKLSDKIDFDNILGIIEPVSDFDECQ